MISSSLLSYVSSAYTAESSLKWSEYHPIWNAALTEQDVKLVFVCPDVGELQAVAHETVPAEFDACNETQPLLDA
jgi:hypothetical protein